MLFLEMILEGRIPNFYEIVSITFAFLGAAIIALAKLWNIDVQELKSSFILLS